MKIRFIVLFIVFTTLLWRCEHSKSPVMVKQQSFVVKLTPVHNTLFFTGIIQPLKESTLTVPMDAVIETMPHPYGQMVTKGDVIVTLNSTELQKQYNDTFTDYLKAKDNFTVTHAKFIGTQNLWDNGLLAKNNYLSEKSSLDTARITLMQATRKLSDMLDKMDEHENIDLSTLSIAEFDKVKAALTKQHNLIRLKAPATGLLLYPPKSNDDKATRLSVGSSVKSGQLFALIGDLTGISIEIDVPEIDIDKIHTGMKAYITGIALGKEKLQGKVERVNAQASSNAGSAFPSFNALIEVTNMTQKQRSYIRVGMSATIELIAEGDNQLVIPIAALKQQKGKSIVTIRGTDGKLMTRQVTTGAAQANQVTIKSGLKEGETLVYE